MLGKIHREGVETEDIREIMKLSGKDSWFRKPAKKKTKGQDKTE